jgi:hypothetical protein
VLTRRRALVRVSRLGRYQTARMVERASVIRSDRWRASQQIPDPDLVIQGDQRREIMEIATP